ncbi:nitrogen regulation protein NR(II) [Biformimicrobium ophioploci]|uniref:Sensory histidine kinase/phosphatase NtrB n=1 Tax=Biformimicrobium ophioploci TaxID=3036711 RepID=A0ABQ6LW03_9GAMM|nr:nitrogen regulation protein NR(II) [Microbulbifer sp. NKW57]GMG86241.1 two-component system sensor histidine kinase NtrB [Microbulbifer sp. NKW57]
MLNDSQVRQILDNLSTALLVLDDELTLRYINGAGEDLLATSSERLLGQSVTQLYDESGDAPAEMHSALANGLRFTKRRVEWHLPGGGSCTVDYSVTPVQDQGLLMLEVQPMDRLLRIAREDELIAAHETTRDLVRGMAHEVKNPLGGIRGAAQLLQRELPEPGLEEYTRIIIDEADRLRNLVDRLLGPRRAPKLKPSNVHQLLERVAQLIDAECKGRLRIRRDYDVSIPDLPLDGEQMVQALLNIVRNAMQAIAEGPGLENGEITLRTRVQRQFTIGRHTHRLVCRISVIDNGPGVLPEIRERIFYPMISGRAAGSGIGLSMAQQIVNQHEGLIECDSAPGNTEFSIYLPLQAGQG